jgi:hypothetical protein
MLPYNASDMMRAIQRHHGLELDPEARERDERQRRGPGAGRRAKLRRWIGAVATYVGIL